MLMMKTRHSDKRNFTTSLPIAVIDMINAAAKELGVPKNEIIVQAVTAWDKHLRQEKLAESYRRPNAETRASIEASKLEFKSGQATTYQGKNAVKQMMRDLEAGN